MKCAVGFLGLLFVANARLADSSSTYYYDKTGSSTGKATTIGNRTVYTDQHGSTTGSAQQSGSTTYFSDKTGGSAGKSVISGNRTTYYDRSGSTTGSAQTSGNTTYYYDKTGSSSGKAVTSGGRTIYYNRSGSSVGSSQTTKWPDIDPQGQERLIMIAHRFILLPKVLFGGFGLLIGFFALLFGLEVAAVAVVGSLVLVGLVLLAIALPFLLPIIVPLVLIILITRHSTRRKFAWQFVTKVRGGSASKTKSSIPARVLPPDLR
jgi:YD repeat-containing protein